ncbi:hypothetical protein [uncultured Tyzzerella sp.]|uniref:hypothetical protein n=1 Tax=uncultured Tyzzerella sp. TaxID=2321398 RepID=UPI0029437BC3|nr:hypothetical protein [uncultured Tyzzerella sp.]
MPVLGIIYGIIFALVIIGTIGIFVIKNNILKNVATILMVILSICIGYISFTALPSNYILQRIICLVISILPLLAIPLVFYKKINWLVFKIILVLCMFVTLILSIIM